jgi:DNA-binding transcriptional MerR regulator
VVAEDRAEMTDNDVAEGHEGSEVDGGSAAPKRHDKRRKYSDEQIAAIGQWYQQGLSYDDIRRLSAKRGWPEPGNQKISDVRRQLHIAANRKGSNYTDLEQQLQQQQATIEKLLQRMEALENQQNPPEGLDTP